MPNSRLKSGPKPKKGVNKDRLDPTHAKVVKYFMLGYTKRDCLRKAGYSELTACTDLYRVFNRPDIIKEIAKRQKMAAKRAQIDADWVIDRLVSIADANLGDLIEIDKEGQPRFNWENLSPTMRRALGEFSVDEYQEGRGSERRPVKRIRVKMTDKLRALEMLAKHLGLFEEKNKLSLEVSLIDRLQEGRNRAAKEDD